MGNKLIISEDELYNLYIIKNLSISEISNIFNTYIPNGEKLK